MAQLKDSEYAFLKTAQRRLITAAGGVESAGQVSRVGKSKMSDYQNADRSDCYMPADVIADLEDDTGVNHVTQALARIAGGYFAKVRHDASHPLFADALRVIGEDTGRLFADGTKIMKDKPEARDIAAVLGDIDELISAAATLRGAIEELANKKA